MFAAPVVLETPGVGGVQPCGVGRWQTQERGTITRQLQMCGFEDINGDGITDRLSYDGTSLATFVNGLMFLGTGDMTAPFSTSAVIRLPGVIGEIRTSMVATDDQGHFRPTACPSEETLPDDQVRPNETFPTQRTVGLRDINGDGLADYIVGQPATTGVWTVAFGTGTGFAPPTDVDSPVGLELSAELVGCFGKASSATTRGLYDIDGDGQPEVVVLKNGKLDLYQLNATYVSPDIGNAPSPPTIGRLVKIDNGYGASTHIAYRSAKEDATTAHLVPYPEIVVAAVSTRDSFNTALTAPTLYAYGGAHLVFDPAFDAYRFPGYERSIQLQGTSDQVVPPPTEAIATINDFRGLDPFTGGGDAASRVVRYLVVGRPSDSTTLSGNLGMDPWALLTTNIVADPRRVSGTHTVWNGRVLPAGPSGNESCLDLVFPYSLQDSIAQSLGTDMWRGAARRARHRSATTAPWWSPRRTPWPSTTLGG